jgi:hypothetical protein
VNFKSKISLSVLAKLNILPRIVFFITQSRIGKVGQTLFRLGKFTFLWPEPERRFSYPSGTRVWNLRLEENRYSSISADSWSNMIKHDQTWSETWSDTIRHDFDQTWPADLIRTDSLATTRLAESCLEETGQTCKLWRAVAVFSNNEQMQSCGLEFRHNLVLHLKQSSYSRVRTK